MSEQQGLGGNSSASEEQPEEPKKIRKPSSKNTNKIVINLVDCQYPVVSRVAKQLGWRNSREEGMEWDVCWTDNAVQPETLLRMEPYQKINHFPGMFNLARKNLMGRYLMKMRRKFADDYSFFPLTWMLPVEYHELKAYFESKPKGKARTFIVKPQALSQGKGIYLTRKLQQIDQNAHCIVQRYLHRPYLIQGLKFDLRVYVLVASVDPLRLYIYHEGLTRFATEKYEPPTKQNMEDTCMHLTNYAINKGNPKFVFNNSTTDLSKGHKRSLSWLFEHLEKNDPRGTGLKEKIEDMIVKTMISGLPPITNTYRSCQPENYASNMCFELLGFDVMLTDKCEPFLLQINHTPSFSTDTPLDNLIKTNYIKDSLTLMNISLKNKEAIVKERRQACQQRVITGRKVKLTVEEKQNERSKAQSEREKYQAAHLGGFKKIFPLDDMDRMEKYEEFLRFSSENFQQLTGGKKVISVKKSEKIQSAFGTCFTRPKQSSLVKGRTTAPEPDKNNMMNRRCQTRKILCEDLEEGHADKMTYSENLISPKSAKQIESDGAVVLNSYIEKQQPGRCVMDFINQKQTGYDSHTDLKIQKIVDFGLLPKKIKSEQSHMVSSNVVTQKSANQREFFRKASQRTENRLDFEDENNKNVASHHLNNSIKKSYIKSIHEAPPLTAKQKIEPKTKNMEMFISYQGKNNYTNLFSMRPYQQSEGQTKSIEQQNLTIFGQNQARKKQPQRGLNTTGNPKSSGLISRWESRKSRHVTNREKIPILLNTLLIGNCETTPVVSAQSLRRFMTNPSKS